MQHTTWPTLIASQSSEPARPTSDGFAAEDGVRGPRSFSQIPRSVSPLGALFLANKGRMLATFALCNGENVLRLAQPLVLGLAINDLLRSSYFGLMVFVVQHLAHTLISSFRRMVDTRAFTAIYTELATRSIVEERDRDADAVRVAARSALSRECVEFFERHIPLLIRAFYSVVGALALLGYYDWTLIPFCAALAIPAFLLSAASGRKTLELSGLLHDDLKHEVDVINRGDADEVRDHYQSVAQWRVKLSDAEAINFSLMELFVLGLMLACLVHFCTTSTAQPGDIFAVFRYVLMFVVGLDSVPRLVQQFSRLRDISMRTQRCEGRGSADGR